MRGINKILILFLLLLFIITGAIWNIIRSPYFIEIASTKVNDIISREIDAEVQFRGFDVSLIPLRTSLYDVNINKFGELSVRVAQLDLSFSVWDLFKSHINISGIAISDGYVILNIKPESKKESKSFDLTEINAFDFYKTKISEKIPFDIKRVELNEIDLQVNEDVYNISRFVFKPYRYSYELMSELRNLSYKGYEIDLLKLDAEIDQKKIRLIDFKAITGSEEIGAFGEIDQNMKKSFKIQATYNGDFSLLKMPEILNCAKSENIININGNLEKISAKSKGELVGVKSKYALIDKVNYVASYQNGLLKIVELSANRNQGSLKLVEPSIINFDNFTVSPLSFELENFHSHDLLYFLGEKFKILSSTISGKAQLSFEDEIIRISSSEGVNLEDTSVGFDQKIIDIGNASLSDFYIELYEKIVNISSDVKVEESDVSVSGYIDGSDIDLTVFGEDISVSDIGGAIGKSVQGQGDVELEFIGPLKDVKIVTNQLALRDVIILGYGINGEIDGEITYFFNSSQLNVDDIILPDDMGKARGWVNFKDQKLDVELMFKDIKTTELPLIIKPHWNDVQRFLNPLRGLASGELLLNGNFSKINIESKIHSKKFSAFNEVLDELSFELLVKDKVLKLKDISVKKKTATVVGDLVLDSNGLQKIYTKVSGLNVDDVDAFRNLGLNYSGVLNGNFDYELINGKPIADGRLVLLRSSIGKKKIRPSVLRASLSDEKWRVDSSLLGDRLQVKSEIYVGERSNEASYVNASAFISDLKTIFGMISTRNEFNTSLEGDLKADGRFSFRLDNPKDFDLIVNFNRFYLKYFDKQIALQDEGRIIVRNSNIEDMSLLVRGTGGSYQLKGSGNRTDGYKVEQNFVVDLLYTGLFTDVVKQVGGEIYGRGILSGDLDNLNNYHEINGRNVKFKVNDELGAFTNGSFESVFKNDLWTFKVVEVDFEGGNLKGEGFAKLRFGFPVLDFSLTAKDVVLKPIENTKLFVDSSLSLSGKRLPYLLKGQLGIDGGSVESNLTSFQSKSKYLQAVTKYIKNDFDGESDFIKTDIEVKSTKSIQLKNRLADMLLNTDFKILGTINSPILDGEITVVPDISKFKFKGNEFVIKNGRIILSDGTSSDSVVLNFESTATVIDYKVRMKVFGGTDDLKINLESTPALSQDDIFSLLVLGYTQDLSRNIDPSQQASLATLSLGTMLVDQLKINEGLDSTLGLKLSVLPEFTESDDSPIQASRSAQQSRLQSATKLKIQKKITEDIDFSFSNRFGGNAAQRQEMNLDFNLNNNWSIQGVIENTNESDAEREGEQNSAGADVRYKWSF